MPKKNKVIPLTECFNQFSFPLEFNKCDEIQRNEKNRKFQFEPIPIDHEFGPPPDNEDFIISAEKEIDENEFFLF